MFKVTEFINHFNKHDDFARTSKFEVLIAPPPVLSDLKTYDLRFQCENTELPGYSINAVENRIYGVSEPVAGFPTSFADITLNFICAGDMWEKKLFDRWINYIIPIYNYNPRYKDDYSTKIEVNQYTDISSTANDVSAQVTSSSQKIYSAVLFGAFPVSIAPLSLNWADDNFHRLAVTFKYDYWLPGTNNPAIPANEQTKIVPPNGTPSSQTIPTPNRGNMTKPTPFKGGGGTFAGGGASGKW